MEEIKQAPMNIRLVELEEENKKLKSDIKRYEKEEDRLREENKKLNERISFLEQCLDNKEKVNKSLREENEILRCNKGGTPEKVGHEEMIQYLMKENKKLKEKNELLKQCLDKLMFDTDVVNVKIYGELGDYVYVRSDKQFKSNIED